jgi:hypothetical protein
VGAQPPRSSPLERTPAVSIPTGSGGDPSPGADNGLWTPVQSWLAARQGRGVTAAALVLLGLQALLRGYVTFSGWFAVDDFAFTTRALENPLWSTDYLLTPWNGHVMPGAFAWVHVLANRWPLDYVPVGVTDLALQALTGWVVFLALRRLFGSRPGILVPLTFYLFSVITLPASVWWAAALNQLPGQLSVAAMLWFHLGYLRSGRVAWGVAGAGMLLFGLMFSEKVLLAPPLVFALTLFWFAAGPPRQRVRATLRDHRRVWAAYLAVGVPYAVAYVLLVPSPVDATASVDTVLRAVGIDVARALLPAVFGGPYSWAPLGLPAVADPSTAVLVLSLMATVLVVMWTVVRRYRAVFAWIVVAGYVLANATIVAVTRGAQFGPGVLLEYRYSTDVALVAAVFAPLAFASISGVGWRWPPQRLAPRRTTPGRLWSWRPDEVTTTVVATTLLVAGCTVSTLQFTPFWRNDVTPRFVATVQADLERADRSVPVADVVTPADAAPPRLQMTWPLSTVLAPLDPAPVFLQPGGSTEELFTVDGDGHVRGAAINGPANRPAPDPVCGWKVEDEPVAIPLEGSTVGWRWVARVGYLASMDAETDVTVGETTTHVDIRAGVHQFYVVGEGSVDRVVLSGLTYGTLCTSEIVVGAVEPIPRSQP